MSKTLPYFLGCPAWSNRDWIGSVFRPGLDTSDLLREYGRYFNTVEGNSLYYALPPLATVERWMAETPPQFRFAPKFPKAISHERRLANASAETAAFLKVLAALADGDKLGVSFLQLPPSFNINNLDTLSRYLKELPSDFSYALEVRHVSWFDGGDNEKLLNDLLENTGIDKVIFDTRPLFAYDPDSDEERDAQSRKPQMPVRQIALSKHPVVRFVGKNEIEKNEAYLKEWIPVINKWILEGRKPYIFAHAGDDAFAPFVARQIHQHLKRINPLLPDLPAFESDRSPSNDNIEQLDLF